MLTLDSTVAEFRQGGFLVKVSSQCCLQELFICHGRGRRFHTIHTQLCSEFEHSLKHSLLSARDVVLASKKPRGRPRLLSLGSR